MNANMQIDDALNKMLNNAMEQSRFRLQTRDKYVIGIFYGEVIQDIQDMLKTELTAKMGSEYPFIMSKLSEGCNIGQIAEEEISHYRKRVNNAELSQKNDYFLPVVFMADQMKADALKASVGELRECLRKLGFDQVEVCFYCIYDYSTMCDKGCMEQLDLLQQGEEGEVHPLYIFTQNHMGDDAYEKYSKAVQAIAMHIFLQTSIKDQRDTREGVPINASRICTCGYWKLDVLKQCLTDILIRQIEKQNEVTVAKKDYQGRLGRQIEEAVGLDAEKYLSAMRQMPVRYDLIEPKLRGHFLRKEHMSYGALFQDLYGEREIFTIFLRNNCKPLDEQACENLFRKIRLGNIYEVENYLSYSLEELKKEWNEKLEEMKKAVDHVAAVFTLERSTSLPELTTGLSNMFWRKEAEMFSIERYLQFAEWLQEKIHSAGFKEGLKERKAKNVRQSNLLSTIRREVAMSDEQILQTIDINLDMLDRDIEPEYSDDVLDEKFMNRLRLNMEDIKEKVDVWAKSNLVSNLGNFATRVNSLKDTQKLETYFAARFGHISPDHADSLLERVFRAPSDQNMMDREDAERIVTSRFNASLEERKWQTDMCFELFSVQEIDRLDRIYNMN